MSFYGFKAKFDKSCYSAETKHWKVELVDLGEGWSGDYNPDDPKDTPLLRFDYSKRANSKSPWVEAEDSSYCTQLNANVVDKYKRLRKRILMHLLAQVNDFSPDRSIKKLGEQLSWISEDDACFAPYKKLK